VERLDRPLAGLVARCASTDDVVAAVRATTGSDVPLAVRSGGHSFPGLSVCDDGVVIDLGTMNEVHVDPDARAARVQGGALLGDVDRATQAAGLAIPAGIVTHTGVAGLTLGGGIGWLMRKLGLTIDQLLGAEVVTASGDVVRASETENADLFWGVRGARATSGSSRSSSSASTRSARRSWPARSSGRWSSRRASCASTATGSPMRPTTS
jgi:FAD/FMN-containing dehydrogenase